MARQMLICINKASSIQYRECDSYFNSHRLKKVLTAYLQTKTDNIWLFRKDGQQVINCCFDSDNGSNSYCWSDKWWVLLCQIDCQIYSGVRRRISSNQRMLRKRSLQHFLLQLWRRMSCVDCIFPGTDGGFNIFILQLLHSQIEIIAEIKIFFE